MDGFNLYQWIKGTHSGSLAKFVLMTGLIDPQVQEFCSRNNCYHSQKPFTKKDVFELVEQALEKSKSSKAKS